MTKDENLKNIKFTKHALSRARARKLWSYVSKAKFFYDAEFLERDRSKLGDCIYVHVKNGEIIKILTMYHVQ